jgi:hypothetical protein
VVSKAAAGRSPASSNSNQARSPAKVVSKADSRAVSSRTANCLTWRKLLQPRQRGFFFIHSADEPRRLEAAAVWLHDGNDVAQVRPFRQSPSERKSRYYDQSSSASRFAASAFGFLTVT